MALLTSQNSLTTALAAKSSLTSAKQNASTRTLHGSMPPKLFSSSNSYTSVKELHIEILNQKTCYWTRKAISNWWILALRNDLVTVSSSQDGDGKRSTSLKRRNSLTIPKGKHTLSAERQST